jgi:hypothetical protein
MVLVVRAWIEDGRPDGFRARLIQAAGPETFPGPSEQIVTTSLDETVRAVRAWLDALDAGTDTRSPGAASR